MKTRMRCSKLRRRTQNPGSSVASFRWNRTRQIRHAGGPEIDGLIHGRMGAALGLSRRNWIKHWRVRVNGGWKKKCIFFDAWTPLFSPVHGEFTLTAGSVMVLFNRSILHYLSNSPGGLWMRPDMLTKASPAST